MAEELRVVAPALYLAGAHGLEVRSARSRDVEAAVSPPVHALGSELADRSPGAVGAIDRELEAVDAKRPAGEVTAAG